MVAKTPPAREKRMALASAALNPTLIRETVNKVDRCVARLQELQYTVSGGRKVVGGVSLSPRSTKGYIRTSLRCKHEAAALRLRSNNRSPPGKFPGEWRQMSLPAMLLGETVVEILQATQFAKQAVATAAAAAAATTSTIVDPKTPVTHQSRVKPETPELRAKRSREKQRLRGGATRSEDHTSSSSPTLLPRARARRITFKPTSPPSRRGVLVGGGGGESNMAGIYRHVVAAHRVSPRNNRPWAKKTTALLFPNLAYSNITSSSPPANRNNNQPCKVKLIPKVRQSTFSPPHKFIVKSPPTAASNKFQVRIRSPPPAMTTFSPPTRSRPTMRTSTPSKLRRSFSPSRLANRLVSPLKSRISSACRRRKSMSSSGGGFKNSIFGTPVVVKASR